MKKMTLLGLVGVFFIIFLSMGISIDSPIEESPSLVMEKIDFSKRALVQSTSTIIVVEQTPEEPDAIVHARNLLQRTDSGAEVMELQAMLNTHGAGLEVDGLFGDLTRHAVIDFQEEHGLFVDGFVGEQTWGKLLELANGVSQISADQSESIDCTDEIQK